jgi:signal peptidase I
MSQATAVRSPKKSSEEKAERSESYVIRETLESFAVALILAFMFRAFVAEIFVIPTGSMAPTLMGAHKDVACAETGFQFTTGASQETDTETGQMNSDVVVGTTCPISRRQTLLDLENKPNDTTFSGDRIIVSKFSYLWRDPKRWDVIVFKNPNEARLNFIKRCIGLPDETIRIQHGDIYVKPKGNDEFSIARKPPKVINAMLQTVSDTNYPMKSAVKAGFPSSWQPYPGIGQGNLGWDLKADTPIYENGWTITQAEEEWSAEFKPDEKSSTESWLRYHHRILTPMQWESIDASGSLPAPIPPYASRLIADFTAYNSGIWKSRSSVYDRGNTFNPSYRDGFRPSDPARGGFRPSETDGRHWTGDLASEFDIELGSGEGAVKLDLVEAGTHYLCEINLADGQAKLTAIVDGQSQAVFEDGKNGYVEAPTAKTSVRANARVRLKYANVDNTLTLWVNGSPVAFSPSNRVATDNSSHLASHAPQFESDDPLDAAPLGLGIQGVTAKVGRARVWRDIYYIAAASRSAYDPIIDDFQFASHLRQSLSDADIEAYRQRYYPQLKLKNVVLSEPENRDIFFSSPKLWANSAVFANRRIVDFQLGPDDFFPMGDNSAASADARSWGGKNLERRLLIGRAVSVLFPHVWMEPIPYLPNLSRMGLIR